MNTLLTCNLEVLGKYFPLLANRMKRLYEEKKEIPDYISYEKTKNDMLNFKLHIDGCTFFLHSNYDPYREAERWISNIDMAGFDTIAVLGIGLGYHIEKLDERFPHKNKIIIEPDENIFLKLLQVKDISHLVSAKNLLLIVSNDADDIAKTFYNFRDNGLIDNVCFEKLSSYERLYGDWWYGFQKAYIKYFKLYQINVNTAVVFANNWVTNFFENLKQFSISVRLDGYKNVFKNIPAVIVSAGPSLNKNIHLLKELRNKALIISAGSAINILQSHGVIPHIMVGVDGGEGESKIFNNVKSDEIFFAYAPSVHYQGLKNYNGAKLYFSLNVLEYIHWFEQEIGEITQKINSGASVSNVALDIANLLGCKPIILVGQDLSYPNLQSYAEGAVLKEEQDQLIKKFIQQKHKNYIIEKDFEGNPVYTIPSMISIKTYFEQYVASHPDIVCLNGTQGGLPIKGIENKPLAEIINKFCTAQYDIEHLLRKTYQKQREYSGNKKVEIIKFLQKVRSQSEEMKEKAIKRMDLLIGIMNDMDNPRNYKKWKLIELLTDKIEKYELFKFFIYPLCSHFLLAIKNERERKMEVITNIEEKRMYLYKGLLMQYADIKDKIVLINNLSDKILSEMTK